MGGDAPEKTTDGNGKHIKTKLINYARDLALEKLSKTLDKRLAKSRGRGGDKDDGGGDNDDDDDDENDASDDDGHNKRSSHNRGSRRAQDRHRRRHAHPDDDDDDEESTSTAVHRRVRRHSHLRRQSPPSERYHRHSATPNKRRHRGRRSGSGHSSDVDEEDTEDVQQINNRHRRSGRHRRHADSEDDDVTTELVRVRSHRPQHFPVSRRHTSDVSESSRHSRRSSKHHAERKSSSAIEQQRQQWAHVQPSDGSVSTSSRKPTLAPPSRQTPPNAPMPQRRFTQPPQPTGFPISDAHLMLAPAAHKRHGSKRTSRLIRKSPNDDADDDDEEFLTATDDDTTDGSDSDGGSGARRDKSASETATSESADTVIMTRSSRGKTYAAVASKFEQRGSAASGSGSARRSSHNRRSSSNHFTAEQRPKSVLTKPRPTYLAIDIPEEMPRKDHSHDNGGKDGKPRTPHVGSPGFNGNSTADYSGYIQKKSLAQGMMDLALLSANINQMRYLLEYKDNQPYFATSFTLVITSLLLQIGVSLTLIWNIRFNVKKRDEMREADRVNNIGVIGIFLVTVINVALSTFGGAPAPKEIMVGGAAAVAGGIGGDVGGGGLAGLGDSVVRSEDGGGAFTVEPQIYT